MQQPYKLNGIITPILCMRKGRSKAVKWQVILLLLLSRFSRVRLCATPETAAHQAPCPWDSAGKNTGVCCHFLLQCTKIKSESEVVQSCPTLCDPMDCSLPGSSAHGIFQARVLEWVAIAFWIYYYWVYNRGCVFSHVRGLQPTRHLVHGILHARILE